MVNALTVLARACIVPELDDMKREAVATGNTAAVDAIVRREVAREFCEASNCRACQCEDSGVWLQPLEAVLH